MRIERDRPQNRMDKHEYQAAVAEAEPDQRQRQQRDRGQGIEHRGQRFQEIGADTRRDGDNGQQCGEQDARCIPDQKHLNRGPGLAQKSAADDALIEGFDGGGECREQQGVVEESGIDLPDDGERNQNECLADRGLVIDALPGRKRLFDDAEFRRVDGFANNVRALRHCISHERPPLLPQLRRQTACRESFVPAPSRPRFLPVREEGCSSRP